LYRTAVNFGPDRSTGSCCVTVLDDGAQSNELDPEANPTA